MAQPCPATTTAGTPVTIAATESATGVPVLHVAGEVDLSTIGCVREAITQLCHPRGLVLDLTAVTFFAVCGVDLLVEAAARVPVRVVADSRAVLRVLAATRVDGQIPCETTLTDALACFSA